MNLNTKKARLAGLIYVLIAIIGAFCILDVPLMLIELDNTNIIQWFQTVLKKI
jgi:hypothetical protein